MKKALILIASTAFLLNFSATAGENPGKANWDRHCSKCHGDTGAGDTRIGEKLEILDYTDPAVLGEYSDEELFAMTKDGVDGSKMRGYGGKLSDDEIHALVDYMRSFAPAE